MFAFTKVFGVACLVAVAESFAPSATFATTPRLNTAAVSRSARAPALGLSMGPSRAVDEDAWFTYMSDRKYLDKLYKNNDKWVEKMTKDDPEYFGKMVSSPGVHSCHIPWDPFSHLLFLSSRSRQFSLEHVAVSSVSLRARKKTQPRATNNL